MDNAKKLYSVRLSEEKIQILRDKYSIDSVTELLEKLIYKDIVGDAVEPNRIKFPIGRLGGKDQIRKQIVDLMPDIYTTYVDVFGGSLAVLFAKPESTVEIVNDKDEAWANLYRMLKKYPIEMAKRLDELPVSRVQFEKFQKEPIPKDDIDRAVRMIYLARLAYNGDGRNSFAVSRDRNRARRLRKIQDELVFVSDRLHNVTIEQMDWAYILRKYQSPETLFFIDAPYIIMGKKTGIYEQEFTYRDNYELSQRIKETQGKFLVTHIENDAYDRWYSDFSRHELEYIYRSKSNSDGTKKRVVEVVYRNY